MSIVTEAVPNREKAAMGKAKNESQSIISESDSGTASTNPALLAPHGRPWAPLHCEDGGVMSYILTVGSERRHRAGTATTSLLLAEHEYPPATAWGRLSHQPSRRAPLEDLLADPLRVLLVAAGHPWSSEAPPHATLLPETSPSSHVAPGTEAGTLARTLERWPTLHLPDSHTVLTHVVDEIRAWVGLFSARLREGAPGHTLTVTKHGSC